MPVMVMSDGGDIVLNSVVKSVARFEGWIQSCLKGNGLIKIHGGVGVWGWRWADGGKLFGGSVAITRRPMGRSTEFWLIG